MSQSYPQLGEVVQASTVVTNRPNPRAARRIIWLLAGCVALMMTGFGIIMPVFARRLSEMGAGVEALGWMTMAFALAQFVASPFMGSAADRFGRKPLILLSLASFVLANIGYLLAPTVTAFIIIRAAAGAFTAGLFPAAMGVVADIMPEKERARWIGIIMGGYGAGIVLGPVFGGLLYDNLGFAMPFVSSAIVATVALITAAIVIPETRPASVRRREQAISPQPADSIWNSLPRPLTIFGVLLLLDFVPQFAFTMVEPQMVFYFYDELQWTTAQFGIVVGAYGLAMMLGQVFLGQVSDRFGRKPIVLAGLLIASILYVGLAFVTGFFLILLIAALSGFGMALAAPALSAFYLDITAARHRSRIQGIKGSALALGGVLGPLTLVAVSPFLSATAIFLLAGAVLLIAIVIGAIFLREPDKLAQEDTTVVSNDQRNLAAQASLRGLVLYATTTRETP